MARKPKARARKPATYPDTMTTVATSVPRLLDRVLALLGTCDFRSTSWGRDMRSAARAHLAYVQVLLSLSPPPEYRERHLALIRSMRRAGDALEALAELVVVDDADFDLAASQRVLRDLTYAHVGVGVTLAGLTDAFQASPGGPDEDPPPALVA